MRFFADGPNIPDELLEGHDQGSVVFLCGAGVSYRAGMPDFLGLAKHVVEELGVPENAESRTLLSWWDRDIPAAARPPLDQIFNLLQQEYPKSDIDDLIAERLRTKPETDMTAHEIVLRLSRGDDGKPRLVTTNFDLLFEQAAGQALTTHVPPTLPDLAADQSLSGIVHLHGRINPETGQGESRQEFVVSSADFGWAYLAQGWATRFMRDLLDRYSVVLLGYSANDPPVRYLLQGLHTRRRGQRVRLFAFDNGAEAEVKQRWQDRGIRAIAYSDPEHSVLWDTLSAWAGRADDPVAWRDKVVDLARKGPRSLAPHERGQVASLLRTDEGAKLFAEAEPPPPGEWLCVFDRNVRYDHSFNNLQHDFDLLPEYGLDDDPPRPPTDPIPPDADDLLSPRSADRRTEEIGRLAGDSRQHVISLPARLIQLARWIAKIAHEPVAPWWAARQSGLHPDLLDRLERRIGNADDELLHPARRVWRLLIEKFRMSPDKNHDVSYSETLKRIKAEGWSNGVLRAFERSSEPYLKTELLIDLDGSGPPPGDWADIHPGQIASFDVAFPAARSEGLEIPDDVLPAVYQVLRRHLERTAGLLEDTGRESEFWQTTTFYPEDKPGERHLAERDAYLFWFRDMFDRMAKAQPEFLRVDMTLWPQDELFFFNKLRLYAWTFKELFSGDDVGAGLLSLSDKALWKDYDRRELLHLLKHRWHDLPADKRKLLEQRLINGRARYDGEAEEEYTKDRSRRSARVLGWLIQQGCDVSDTTHQALTVLRKATPGWRPEWDENADESYGVEGGTFRTDPDPSPIIDAPLCQIIPLAKEYTRSSFDELIHHKPFDGLVKQRPSRAVAALTNAARQGDYPLEFWSSAAHNWPEKAKPRLVWLFGARLARLPSETVVELQSAVFWWLERHLPELAVQDQDRALSILDVLLDKLFDGKTEAKEGRSGSSDILTQAINSPVGEAAGLLLHILASQEPEKGPGLPPEIQSRLERLIAAPGEGSAQAVCIVARQLLWLDSLDPEWTRRTVVPWFNLEHPKADAAWSGFLWGDRLPRAELFSSLKSCFLERFSSASKSNWDAGFDRLHEFLLIGCFWYLDDPAYISFEEARRALQQTDDEGRARSLEFLAWQLGKNREWVNFSKLFLGKAWPKEKRFRTERIAEQFAELALNAGEAFPEVVDTILPFLVPISQGNPLVYGLMEQNKDEDGSALLRRFPDATLKLLNKLVPDNPDRIPYGLDDVVKMVAEAKPSLCRDSRWRRLRGITPKR